MVLPHRPALLPTPALVADSKWRKPCTVAVGLSVKVAPRVRMGSGSSKMSMVIGRPSATGGCDERTPEHKAPKEMVAG